ncbi:MAG: FliM/FliN family flagellar motor switch protein [Myxococcales bacterium]|nr:FliM/FliN family flagellar motor switch protein [Myxococcales bacterium]
MNPNDTPIDALADVPLVVRVELGVAELSASAWAKTRPGDVLTLGRKVGDPVVLRVSGTEIAQGELVHVDGELAVRILSRSGDLAR